MEEIPIKAIYTVPNQKIIHCHNFTGKIPDGQDFDIVIHSIDKEAMRRLSGNAYKLYAYMRKNKDGYIFALSCKDACDYTGLKEKSYSSAVKELLGAGYLTKRDGQSNVYDFSIMTRNAAQTGIPLYDERGTVQTLPGDSPPEKDGPSPRKRDIVHPKEDSRPPESGGEIIHNNTGYNRNNKKSSTENNIGNRWESLPDNEEFDLPF